MAVRDETDAVPGEGPAWLRIIATSDVHAHIVPYDYHAGTPAPAGGLANAARLIAELRRERAGALLVDNGDFLQGTALADAAVEAGGDGTGKAGDEDAGGAVWPHPAIASMNALGYDAAALGNHEFNYGLPFLERCIADAGFPILSANLSRSRGTPLVPPWVVVDRSLPLASGGTARVRIGLIGLLPPQTLQWDRSHLQGRVQTEDILAAAAREVPRIRAAGADVIVALCHSGIEAEAHTPGMENAAVPLAALPGIDAVVSGHTHRLFPAADFPGSAAVDPALGLLHGKPAVMPGFNASHVGCIDLALARRDGATDDGPRWEVVEASARVLPVTAPCAMEEDPAAAPVLAATAAAHRAALALAERPIGRTRTRITSYFALAGPSAALTLVAEAQRAHVEAAAPVLPDLPLLSAAACFRAGGRGGPGHYVDIPPGPLAYRNATELYPYPNNLVVLELTGADVADWLERSAAVFRTVTPGSRGTPLLHPGVPAYTFDVIDGVTWQVDLSRPPRYDPAGRLLDPAAARVRDLRLSGAPLDPAARVLVVTNSYRHGGGGGVEAATRGVLRYRSRHATREAVAQFIKARGEIAPEARESWGFAPLSPGATAIFETGPGAEAAGLPRIGRGLTPLGIGPEGFARFEIAL